MEYKAVSLNLERDASLLTGKERARLVIKDAHEKQYGNKKGFLTDGEINALRTMTDHKTSEEYAFYWEIVTKVPVIMGAEK